MNITLQAVYEYIFKKGCLNITCIDFCHEVIQEQINNLNPLYDGKVSFIWMDARSMDFEGRRFDLVIDKGTLDSILCADTSMNHINKYLDCVDNCLAEGGTFLVISQGEPKFRDKYLKRQSWVYSVTEFKLPILEPTPKDDPKDKKKKKRRHKKPEEHIVYLYFCTKGGMFADKEKEEILNKDVNIEPK